MKRVTAIILTFLITATLLPGCTAPGTQSDGKTSIVCTIFPQYDWVKQILGDRADDFEITLLLSGRADMHSFQPTVQDFAKISSCDLLIYVGGESDAWVEQTLRDATNKNMLTVNLFERLGDAAKEEELLEGMTAGDADSGDDSLSGDDSHRGGDSHGDGDSHSDDDEIEYDEHVWLSLGNAVVFCRAIAEAISQLDADNTVAYNDNLNSYIVRLDALDSEYRAMVGSAPVKTLLFGDRFPFRYLTDDYGLVPFAAFPGCSAETEASFDTFIFLANKIDELGLAYVLVTESADRSVARAIIGITIEKNQKILVLDSMQSVSPDDIRNGTTYISIMESNLSILTEALRDP